MATGVFENSNKMYGRAESEAAVQDALDKAMRDASRAVIVIAHRQAAVGLCTADSICRRSASDQITD